MKLDTNTVLLLLILVSIIGLYLYKPRESFLYGGPYEDAQDRLCGQYNEVSSRKSCMCHYKPQIKKQCEQICRDPDLKLHSQALSSCLDACQPIPGLDPCSN